MTRSAAALLLLTFCFLSDLARAAEINGTKLPDQVAVAGRTLNLNGAGLRQATILRVNVYAAGLYLAVPSHDSDAIAKSDEPKAIEMVFLRDVSAKQIGDALREGIDKNCEGDCSTIKAELDQLGKSLRDVKKGEHMTYHFLGDHVDVLLGDSKVGSVRGKGASGELIRCWIGRNPPNTGLKEGLLGAKAR